MSRQKPFARPWVQVVSCSALVGQGSFVMIWSVVVAAQSAPVLSASVLLASLGLSRLCPVAPGDTFLGMLAQAAAEWFHSHHL